MSLSLLPPFVGSRRNHTDFLLEFCPEPPKTRPREAGGHPWDDEELEKTFKQVNDHRSATLHGGTPFPAPMCFYPLKAEGWKTVGEVSLRGITSMAGGVWAGKDTRLLLIIPTSISFDGR